MTEHLTDTEWTDVLATLPENPDEAADGWELSLVRRTVNRILAAREQALREQIAQAWDNGVVHGRCCPSEFVTTPCLSNPYREGVGGE